MRVKEVIMSLAVHYWVRDAHHCSGHPVSKMTYTVSSGALNSTIPYHHAPVARYSLFVLKVPLNSKQTNEPMQLCIQCTKGVAVVMQTSSFCWTDWRTPQSTFTPWSSCCRERRGHSSTTWCRQDTNPCWQRSSVTRYGCWAYIHSFYFLNKIHTVNKSWMQD